MLIAGLLFASAGFGAHRWYRTTRPDYRLHRGLEAVRRGELATAETLVGRLQSAGHQDQANLLQAALHLERGQPNDAVSCFNEIEETPHRVEGAILYGEWLIRHRLQPAEAERLLRFVLSERPDNAVAHRGLAAIYYDQGAWAAAVTHLLRWAEVDEQDGRPYRFMGLIYKDMDQPTPAIPSYQEALQRDLPAAIKQEVREELAECLTAKSQFTDALDILNACGERGEQVPRLLALRGECLAGLGRTDEAGRLLDEALEWSPRSLDLLRIRGKLLFHAGKLDRAAPLFERALRLDPHDTTSRYHLSLAFEQLNRKEEAARHRQALEQTKQGMLALTKLIQEVGDKPWDVDLQKRLADHCTRLERPDLAQKWLRAANASLPKKTQDERKR
jgi:tetratricopeptide (TPR) repeat protein